MHRILRELFNEFGSDKGDNKHRYDRLYEKDFRPIKNDPLNILEVGVSRGGSISAMWEYFPRAQIYGVDKFHKVPISKIPIFKEARVMPCQMNSVNVGPETLVNMWGEEYFDIIIDDGCHRYSSQRATFKNFIPLLKIGGYYYIEDIIPYHLLSEEQKKHKMHGRRGFYTESLYNDLLDEISPYNLEVFDMREGFGYDSCIFKISKPSI